jgi:hypothetical protein
MRKKFLIPVLSAVLLGICPVTAYVMSSQNYRIQSDSLNVGGIPENSESYKTEDTIGEMFAGESESETYNIKSGYQRMQEVMISISLPDEVQLTGDILAISGGTASGEEEITVKTDNPAGYKLELEASTSPALKMGTDDNFSNYEPVAPPVPDYNWMIGVSNSRFGFTVAGADAAPAYRSSGSDCNQAGGTADGVHCWNGFSGTAKLTAAISGEPNHPDGVLTTVNYFAQVKSSGFQTSGRYDAFITATATPL